MAEDLTLVRPLGTRPSMWFKADREQSELEMPPQDQTFPESFKAYEDGKHRRYSLLFAVNGGAFGLPSYMPTSAPRRSSVSCLFKNCPSE
jgi:hypothetical protein